MRLYLTRLAKLLQEWEAIGERLAYAYLHQSRYGYWHWSPFEACKTCETYAIAGVVKWQ